MIQDLRYAIRSLRNSRGFAAVAILTLGLGIGANTALFTVVNAVLIRPPPYEEADGLVVLWHRMLGLGAERARISGPDVVEYRESAQGFQDFAFANGAIDVVLETRDQAEARRHARIGVVTPNFFSVLGVHAHLGRTFEPGEAVFPPEALDDSTFTAPPSVLLLSYGFWQRRFGADVDVVGRSVRVGGAPMTVVGILPRDFELLLPPDVGLAGDIDAWTPLRLPLVSFRRVEGLRDQDSDNTGAVIGRIATGTTLEGARAEMARIAARQRERIPYYRDADMRIEVATMHEDAVRHARPALLALMGAVGFVLLIACINVANLLLARGTARQSEMAVRAALGAGRMRLARQLLAESGTLALLGAGLGTLIAFWGVDLLLALGPADLPRASEIRVDRWVLGFTALTAIAAAILFGSVPALTLSSDADRALRRSGPRAGGGRQARLRKGLVVAEVALSLALLAGAGLMLRSFARLQRVDPGFDPRGLMTFAVTLPGSIGPGSPGERARVMAEFEARLRTIPGVETTGVVGGLPLGGVVWTQPWGVAGSGESEWSGNEANFRVITSGYFDAMGTRLLAGRAFTATEDVSEDARVVIVDQKLARRLAGNGAAVGRRIGFPLDGRPVWATIVGVVEDVRFSSLRRAGRETLYVPYRQEASRTVTVAVRARRSPTELIEPIRRAAEDLEAGVPIPLYDFRPMEEYVGRALAPTRFALALFTLLATLALVLAAVGLFGVVSYLVTQRTREFGIRLALGATADSVLRQVVLGGLRMAAIGIGGGVLLAAATSRAVASLLFEIAPMDAPTYAIVALVLIAVAALACWIPARRAASVEPAVALRHE